MSRQVDGVTLQVDEEMLQVDGVTLQVDEEMLQVDEETLQVDEVMFQVDGVTVQVVQNDAFSYINHQTDEFLLHVDARALTI